MTIAFLFPGQGAQSEGPLFRLLHVDNPENPSAEEIEAVQNELIAAIEDARKSPVDLRSRLESQGAQEIRKSSILTRKTLEAQWAE